MGIATTPLERPIRIGTRIAKNRFVIQPMECGDANLRGSFSEKTLARYENLFRGGAGVVIMESVTLQTKSRARKNQLLLDVNDPDNRDAWEKFVLHKKLHYPDTLLIVQLNHSGELSDESFSERVCVKPLPGFGGKLIDERYIEEVIHSYVEACRFLDHIGVDGVDLKFCHGYLFSQILRPYNDRCWKYGGSFENRVRFAYDLCEKIRFKVPSERFLLGAKVNLYESFPGGQGHAGANSEAIDVSESILLCKGLEDRGLSFFIETLGGGGHGWELMCPNKSCPENVYKHMNMAKLLRKNLKPQTAVICSGLSLLRNGENNGMTDVAPEKGNLFYWGNTCIEQGDFDMIALGRQSLADPSLPLKYTEKRQDEINWCLCCDQCGALLGAQKDTGCPIYNPAYREH